MPQRPLIHFLFRRSERRALQQPLHCTRISPPAMRAVLLCLSTLRRAAGATRGFIYDQPAGRAISWSSDNQRTLHGRTAFSSARYRPLARLLPDSRQRYSEAAVLRASHRGTHMSVH